ncbi:MAG: glycosyltransferase family 4 protein [Cryomorphaceae bacterium]
MAAKKVLIITYYWPPAGGAGVQRWLKMAKYLPEFGIEPVVLTVDESYASYPVVDRSFLEDVAATTKVYRTRSFEPLRIYGKLFGKKKVPYSGFTNVNTGTLGSKLSRWVRGNFFIPDARKGWNRYALPKAAEIIKRENIDTVITTGPPHSTHLIGLALKSKKPSIKWIADFRDPWTDIYYYEDLLHSERSKAKDLKLEKMVLSQSDLVLSVCPSNRELLAKKLPEDQRSKIKLITNGFDEGDFESVASKTENDCFNMVYTGTIAPSYNSIPIFEILKRIPFKWKLTFAGSISPDILEWFKQAGMDANLDYRGYVDHKQALTILQEGDLLLHILPDTEKNKYGTTGKLFEYIGSGIPILNIGPKRGDAAKFIADAGSGKTFTRDEEVNIIHFINWVNQGEASLGTDIGKFSRRKITQDLADLFRNTDS